MKMTVKNLIMAWLNGWGNEAQIIQTAHINATEESMWEWLVTKCDEQMNNTELELEEMAENMAIELMEQSRLFNR